MSEKTSRHSRERANLVLDLIGVVATETPAEALQLTVAALRAHLGWAVGHAWMNDGYDRLAAVAAWSSDGLNAHDSFRDMVRERALEPGEGLAGVALADGAARFAPRLAEQDPRAHAAASAGLLGGVAIPIRAGARTWAVMEFLSCREEAEDADFAVMALRVAAVLGLKFEAQRSARRETFFLDIVDHIAHPIFVKDRRFRFVVLNQALCDLVGFPRATMLGKQDHDFFPREQADFFRWKDEEMFVTASRVVIEEEPITDASGTVHWLATTKVPLTGADGGITHLVGIIHDITQLKAAQSQLRERNAELELVNRELESFSYSVSHDLRTPLRGIDGFTQAVLEDFADQLPEAGREYLSRVRSAAHRMGSLIDDLLALSHVTRALVARADVDISALAEDIIADARAAEPGRVVEVEIAPGLSAKADPALTRVVLENLLRNAWKFTSRQENARIEVGHRDAGGFFVRDNGAGFDPGQSGRLFRPFNRLHSTRDFPGSGVGLATVHRVIARHGGAISAEGSPGRGATFRFTLSD